MSNARILSSDTKNGNRQEKSHGAPPEARSIHAEQVALGAVYQDPAALAILRQMLETRDFGYVPHQHIYERMCIRADKGEVFADDELLANDLCAFYGMKQTEAIAATSPLALAAFDHTRDVQEYCREVLKYALKAARAQLAEWNAGALHRDADEEDIERGSAGAQERIAGIKRRMAGDTGSDDDNGMISARDLMAKTFAPVVEVAPGLITEGLNVVSGKPKMGKSWMLLALAIARASGGCFLSAITLETGPVLYLALEDNERRLQSRMHKLLQGSAIPDGLTLVSSQHLRKWHMNGGGLERIGRWFDQHPHGCVIVDTLAKIQPARRSNNNGYAEDYELGARLKEIADTHHGAIIAVTHNRKASADDPLDEINATTGLMGAFDTGLVLRRERGQADAVLYTTGRDIEDAELALRFDAATCLWSLMGEASKYATTKERAEILRAIEELVQATGKPAQRKHIAEAISKPGNSVGYLLTQMVNAQQVIARDGGYVLLSTPNTPNTPNSTNTPNNPNSQSIRGVRDSEYAPNSADVADMPGNISTLHKTVSGVRGVRDSEDMHRHDFRGPEKTPRGARQCLTCPEYGFPPIA